MKPPEYQTVVLSRCDRLGDLILSLPCLGHLGAAGIRHRILHCAEYAGDIGRWALHNGLCEDLWIAGQVPPGSGRQHEGPLLAIVGGFRARLQAG